LWCRRGHRSGHRIGTAVARDPDLCATPIGAAREGHPDFEVSLEQCGRRFENYRRISSTGRRVPIRDIAGTRLARIQGRRRVATKKFLGRYRKGALVVLLDRGNSYCQRRGAEPGISDLDEVHRLDQAIFPAEFESIRVAKQQCPLQQELSDDRADIDWVDDRSCLKRAVAADAVKIDCRLVESLDDRCIVIVRAVETFELYRIAGIRRCRPRNVDRIVAETAGDRPRARSQSIPAGGYPRIGPGARFLNNEIVLAEAVDRSGVGCIDRAVARDHLITVGDDLQQPARPDNSAVGNFDDIGDMLLRFLLCLEQRRQHDSGGLAICGIESQIAEVPGRETSPIARVGEKVGDDCSRIGVEAIGAAARKQTMTSNEKFGSVAVFPIA